MAAIATPLKALTVPSLTKQTATVIFVHGLGDTGEGWKPVADMFRRDPALGHVKWVLPHAPVKPVTANGGMEMPAWFDILSFGFDQTEDEPGMLQTVYALNALITAEVDAGIPASRIVLGGFSQGGAMALLTGLTTERKLGGVVVLSGWLPLRNKFKAMTSAHARTIPLFWGHGTHDPLVRYAFGRSSADWLSSELKYPTTTLGEGIGGLIFNSYNGVGHSTSQGELDDLKRWIAKVLPE